MFLFRDLPISRKFACAFGIVCLLCTVLGAVALLGFLKVNSAVKTIVTDSMPSIQELGDIRYSLSTIRRTRGGTRLLRNKGLHVCAGEGDGNPRQ